MKRKIDDKVRVIVTFVMFKGECVAFFRAYRSPDDDKWHKYKKSLKAGNSKFSYWATDGYVHNGQHGEYDVEILRHSRRATKKEYQPLLDELEDIGYKVVAVHQKGWLKLKGRK